MSFVVVDLETTGLYPRRGDEIIEIGAIKVENNKVTEETFQSFVKPTKPVPQDAQRISGIADKDLEQAPLIKEVLPSFLQFIGGKLLIAQNAKFDLSFIVNTLERVGYPPFQNNFIDTMLISKLLFFYEREHNLDAIIKRLEIEQSVERHRSLGDCYLTGLTFLKMLVLLSEKGKDSLKSISNCIIKPSDLERESTQPKPLSLF